MPEATATLAFPYPSNTDVPDLNYWNGQLAAALDAYLAAPWVAFTPNVYTGMGTTPATIARTVNRARYRVVGKTCFAQVDVTLGAATSGGAGVDLPVPSKDRVLNCGSALLYGSSTPADQCGAAYMGPDKSKLVIVAYTQGFRDGLTSHTLRYSVAYEVA